MMNQRSFRPHPKLPRTAEELERDNADLRRLLEYSIRERDHFERIFADQKNVLPYFLPDGDQKMRLASKIKALQDDNSGLIVSVHVLEAKRLRWKAVALLFAVVLAIDVASSAVSWPALYQTMTAKLGDK